MTTAPRYTDEHAKAGLDSAPAPIETYGKTIFPATRLK